MTYNEVAQIIKSLGIDYAYYQFDNSVAPKLPYIVYYYPSRDDVMADNTNYVKVENLRIELYTEWKNFELEQQLESILETNHITYSKEETYINGESMFEIIYEGEVLING